MKGVSARKFGKYVTEAEVKGREAKVIEATK
jgi:hypothetical protein